MLISHKPSKQRREAFTAALHRRRKLISAALSTDLRLKYMRRAFPLRQGDVVKIVRGDYSGLEGKVTRVDLGKKTVTVEGVTREKADGKTTHVPIHPSKVVITRLTMEDKWRAQRLSQTPRVEEAEPTGEEEKEEEEKPQQPTPPEEGN